MGKSSKRNSDYNKDAPRLKKHAILESPEPEYSSKANFTLNDDSFSLNSSSSSSKDAESTSSVASSSSSSSSQPDDNASSSSASSSSSFFDELVSQVPNSKVASKEKEQPVREATIFNTFATLAQDPPKRAVTLVGTYMTVDRWSDGSFAFVLHGAIDGVVTLILQESEVKRFCRSLQKHDLLVVTDAIVRLAKTGAYVNARLTNSSCVYVCNRAFPDKVTEETQGSKLESMISSSNVELPQLLELNDIYLAQHLTGKSYRVSLFSFSVLICIIIFVSLCRWSFSSGW